MARFVNSAGKVTVTLQSDGCVGTDREINYLEHVQAVVTLDARKRGQVTIRLTSPLGTQSTLLPLRFKDVSRSGFREWAFMTTHTWGEPASGQWKLEIDNGQTSCELR